MDNYIKTILNGLKAWVTSGLTRLEASVSKLSGNLETMGSKITSLTSKVAKAQTTANNAQSTADNAQSTADNAQSTADNAQTTANSAVGMAEEFTVTYEFDGTTTGLPTFVFNGWKYYKIAELPAGILAAASGKTTSKSGTVHTACEIRPNVMHFGSGFAVAKAGTYAISITSTINAIITVPEPGVYVNWEGNGANLQVTSAEITYKRPWNLDIPNTAPVVFTEDGNGGLVNADGDPPTVEEVYNALMAGVVYVKKDEIYQVVQNFLYEETKITFMIQALIGSNGATQYEVIS